MRYLILLSLVLVIFIGCGLALTNIYTVTVTGFPSIRGLPNLYIDAPGGGIPADRQVDEAPNRPKELAFKFHLSSGTYHTLRWVGNGTRISSPFHFYREGQEKIANLPVPSDEATVNSGDVHLPAPSMLDLLGWLAFYAWPLIVILATFFLYGWGIKKRIRPFPQSFFNRPLPVFLLALVPLGLAFIVPGAIRYDVGDDPAMEMLASGYVSGEPSEYLVFINVLIGLPLKALYLLARQVPWYPVLLLLATFLPLVGITHQLLKKESGRAFLVGVILLNAAFGSYFLTHLQFTSAAYLTGLYGLILLMAKGEWLSLLGALAAVFCCSLIRLESFYLLIGTAGLPVLVLSGRSWLTRGVFFGAAFMLALGGSAFDSHYYKSDQGWASYRYYNSLRGMLHMTPKLSYSEANRPAYAAVGWSKNDYDMFAEHWLYEDAAVFGADKLAYLNRHLVSDRQVGASLALASLPAVLAPAAVLLFLIFILYSFRREVRAKARLAVILLPMLLILLYLVMTARLPARVAVPCLYASSVFMVWTFRASDRAASLQFSRPGFQLAALTVTVIAAWMLILNAQENRESSARLLRSLARLEKGNDQVLVSSINAIQLEKLSPFTALSETSPRDIIHLMWSGESPSFQAQLLRHHSASLFRSLALDPKFLLVIPTSRWDCAESFANYMNQHDHMDIRMTPLMLKDGLPAIFPDFTVMVAQPGKNR